MLNFTSKTRLIFPEESSTVILDILEKYGLKDTEEEFYEKWEKGEKTREEMVVNAVITAAKANLSEPELSILLEEELKIPFEIAEKMARELNLKILRQIYKKEPPIKETPEEITETQKDKYREPIE
jgi:hypothetical protein